MRVRLYRAELRYRGGLVLHTASSGNVPTLDELYLTVEDGSALGLGAVRINIAYLNGLAAEDVLARAVRTLAAIDWRRDAAALLEEQEWTRDAAAPVRMLVDVALHDYLACRAGNSLATFLGGEPGRPVRAATNQTLFWSPFDVFVARATSYVARGFRNLKVRVAAGSFAEDLRRIGALRNMFGTAVTIAADANGQWSEAEAGANLDRLSAFDLAYLEQPLPAGNDAAMLRLAADSPIPLMVDESLAGPRDVDTVLAAEGRLWAHLKLVKLGGIAPTLRAAHRLAAARIPFMVGQMNEGTAATAAALHVACAAQAPMAELYGADGLADDPVTGLAYSEGDVAIEAGLGLGVRLDATRATLIQEF